MEKATPKLAQNGNVVPSIPDRMKCEEVAGAAVHPSQPPNFAVELIFAAEEPFYSVSLLAEVAAAVHPAF